MAVHKRRDGELSIKKHESIIRQYLYDEGPTTTEDLVKVLSISKGRTVDVLDGMRSEGVIVARQLRGNQSFWLLAEDAQDAA